MSLATGTKLGSYDILGPLGAGGMGEVYRARDTRLNRDVALKVLPDSFAGDPDPSAGSGSPRASSRGDRLARFTREAQTLAALNHPNIAHIHGLEESEGVTAIVMELVEGDDLSQRIARGAMTLDEALPIAKQIAEALEAAHEQGIIHRDLKPANIKVRPDGTVKVLDFGLAKALDPTSSSSAQAMNSPTLTARATQMGLILGTAAYMAPEQARGKPVDRRADVWAFGAVLHEMLTGRRLFDAEDVSETLAAVLTRDVTLTPLPDAVPARLRALVRDCLIRDPKQRLRDVGEARRILDTIITGAPENAMASAPASAAIVALSRTRERVAWAAAVVLPGLVAIGAIAWALRPTPPPTVARLAATLPQGDRVAPLLNHALALSPDGSQIAFVAIREASRPQIYLRALDSNESRALPGTEDAEDLFFSPDGRWLGFGANEKLMKVAVGGGVPVPICPAPFLTGASWGDNRTIVFAPYYGGRGLWQVPEGGGAPQKIVSKARTTGEGADTREQADRWPELLPGGQAVLFTAWSREQDNSQVVVERLDTHTRPVAIPGGTSARYVSTGHILYARGAVLWAVPFDVSRLKTTGEPVPVFDGVTLTTQGASQFDLSRTGSLIYVPGDAKGLAKKLIWVDRRGGRVPLAADARNSDARNYRHPRLSPNERQVAVTVQNEQNDDIWVWDITNTRWYPLRSGGESSIPQWTHKDKGGRIVFRSRRNGVWALFSTLANGGGDERQLTTDKFALPVAVSHDDEVVNADPGTRRAWIVPITGDKTPRLFFQTSQTSATGPGVFGEGGSFSGDGHSMAYVSDESGSPEIYVRSFPDGKDQRQISTEGGVSPRFARSGPLEELYYQHGDQMMAVELTLTTRPIVVGKTRELFTGPYEPGFDVTRDGEHFLMLLPNQRQAATHVNVVLNWFEDLKRLVAPAPKK